MTTYDPAVIQKFADRLYARAQTIVFSYAILGAIIGAGVGFAIATAMSTDPFNIGIISSLLVALLGVAIGKEKAFGLKLSAQIALCQVSIEKNTNSGLVTPTSI